MDKMEDIWKSSFRASEMVQEACNSFEEHFLWLEEVVAEAHRTLADDDLLLLPKTPSAAPKRTRRIIKDDAGITPPVTRLSMSNRPGRLCSKVASQRIAQQVKQSLSKKLRRPSSSVTIDPFAPVRCQASLSPPSRSSQQCVKLVLDPRNNNSLQKQEGSSQEDPSSPKKNGISKNNKSFSSLEGNVTTQRDHSSSLDHSYLDRKSSFPLKEVRSPAENNSHLQKEAKSQAREVSSSLKKVISPAKVVSAQINSDLRETAEKSVHGEDLGDSSQSTKTTVISQVLSQEEEQLHLQLEGSFGESVPVDHPEIPEEKEEEEEEEEENMQVVWESADVQEKAEIVTSKSHPSHTPEVTQAKEDGENPLPPNSFSQPPSPDAPSVTCTKQKAVQDVPAPVAPAPRITRTKQRALKIQDVSPLSGNLLQPPSVPAPRVTRTSHRAIEVHDVPPSSDSLPQPPSVPAPRVTRTKQRAIEVHEVQDIPSSSDSLPQPSSAHVPRITCTKQTAIEVQDVLPPGSLPQSSSPSVLEVTSIKQRAVEAQKTTVSPNSLGQLCSASPQKVKCTKQRTIVIQDAMTGATKDASRLIHSKQKTREEQQPHISEEISGRDLNTEDKEEETRSTGTQAKWTQQQEGDERALKTTSLKDSGVFSLGVRMDGWGSAESVSSGSSCAPLLHFSTPPRRITRSKASKLQQVQHSPEKPLPSTSNFQRECCSPRGMQPHSPHKDSPATRRVAMHLGRDGEVEQVSSKVSRSPVRIIRHSPDKIGKVAQAGLQVVSGGAGRITPSIISRMQPFLTASSSSSGSSASAGHRRIIKRTVGTPSDSRRPANIVSGITSFIKSQPVRSTKEEIEEQRVQELRRKKEREEETIRKKEELLRAKTEERKRRNEERMRRVQEARQERLAEVAKEQQERERQREEEQQQRLRQREEEEQQRRQRQLSKRKAEEEARKAAKMKEQEEIKKQEEAKKRQKLEEEQRNQKLQEEKQILENLEEERRNYLAQQKIVLEEMRKLKMGKAQKLVKKVEAEPLQLKQTLLTIKEKELQAKRNWEAKTVMSTTYTSKNTSVLNTTYTTATTTANPIATKEKSGEPLNTTYTRPGGDAGASVRVDSYEMTPLQPKRVSSSLNNYSIDDLQSEDSTDDDATPRKKIPQWAMKTQVIAAILQQEHYPPQMDTIFPPNSLLVLPDLTQIFPKQKRRFRKRTSSAQWGTPPSKVFRVASLT